jgi:hypothetical protein
MLLGPFHCGRCQMAIKDLLEAFEGEENLPVDLNKVKEWILKQAVQDEIEFIGVELDIGAIRGFLHRYRYQKKVYGEAVCAAHIYYGTNQEPEWINIVCAKELIHTMDGNNSVKRKEEFDTLIKRLVLPRELKILLEDPGYALVDKFGDAYAAAILLPMAARDVLKAPYDAGVLTPADISRLAVMPIHYVRMVMSDEWPAAYAKLKGL